MPWPGSGTEPDEIVHDDKRHRLAVAFLFVQVDLAKMPINGQSCREMHRKGVRV